MAACGEMRQVLPLVEESQLLQGLQSGTQLPVHCPQNTPLQQDLLGTCHTSLCRPLPWLLPVELEPNACLSLAVIFHFLGKVS